MNHSPTAILSARELTKHVASGERQLTILDSVNLDVFAGETVAVVGVSGSGKSTLLGLLAGLDLPSTGTITLAGQSLTELDEDGRAEARRGKVGFVFQNFQLLAGLDALENVLLPLELVSERPSSELETIARNALQAVGLADRMQHTAAQLSGGEQQRVAIARAYAPEPSLLFADEPTGNLDQATGETVIDLLMKLNTDRGTTLFIVTHDPRLASRCDRIFEIEAGVLKETTTA